MASKSFGKRHEDCSRSPSSGKELSEAFVKCRKYWVELNVIGLHRQFWNGIDYKIMDNSLLAISIVATYRYDNARRYNGTLVYEGQGGNPIVGEMFHFVIKNWKKEIMSNENYCN
ncbi:hypothetical protein V8G54_016633 [Vigna mungo]|uniref:YDG domain-containing protein n=1 Tax=Vigna mungo TaxID=3915 RepID=A0AAQ3NND2_VIGMU